MIDKIRTISNPLTIIAIFAGLAEISGTAVLPLLEGPSQEIYLWFLMIFPTVLIVLFFLTLNFNYKVLYAPSDFKDEDNFLRLFGKPSPEDRLAKLSEEIFIESSEQVDDSFTEASNYSTSVAVDSKYSEMFRRNATATYYLAEGLVLNKLSDEFDDFRNELVLNSRKHHFMFDAVGEKSGNIYAIEVKYFNAEMNEKSIRSSLNRISKVYKELPSELTKSFNVILAVVSNSTECDLSKMRTEVEAIAESHSFNIEVRTYSLNELENELHGR